MRQHWRDHDHGRVTAISHFWGLQKKLVKNVTLKPSTPKQQREGHQEYSIAAYNAGRANAQLHLTRDLQLQVDPSSANRICLETDPSKTHHGPPPPSTHRLDSRADKLKARIHTRPGEDRQGLLNISNGLSLGSTAVRHMSIKISHPSTLADTTVSKLRHRQGCQNRLRHIGRCGSRDSMQRMKLPEEDTKTKVLQP